MTNRNLIKNSLTLSLTLLIFTALLIVGAIDEDQASIEEIQYCEMTALFTQTNGELGWPAYNRHIECEG